MYVDFTLRFYIFLSSHSTQHWLVVHFQTGFHNLHPTRIVEAGYEDSIRPNLTNVSGLGRGDPDDIQAFFGSDATSMSLVTTLLLMCKNRSSAKYT